MPSLNKPKQVSVNHGVAKIEKAKSSEKTEARIKPDKPAKPKKAKRTPEEQALYKKALHMARVEEVANEILKKDPTYQSRTVYRSEMAYLQAELQVTKEETTESEKRVIRAQQKAQSVIGDDVMSRVFRNEQRNIGRDIKATQREMSKLNPNSTEYNNLNERLRRLEVLQFEMRQKNKVDGEIVYNVRGARIHAFEEYVTKFGGRAKLEEQREQIVNLSYSFGQEVFFHNVSNFYKKAFEEMFDADGLFERTPTYDRLRWEMEQAVREYRYKDVLYAVSQIVHAKKEYYTKYAKPKRISARDVR